MSKMSYEEWIRKVDFWLWNTVGVSHEDLPDVTPSWRTLYESGTTPQRAAYQRIDQERKEMGL